MINGELMVDNFAGGGGASTGMEMATGISVDIAINHDPEAIRIHKTNHPSTKHYCENVWDVDPIEVCKGRPVAIAWFSPDCKQTARRPDYEGDGYADGHLVYDTWICPCCGKHYEVDYDNYNYCPDCGQKLDWSDEE